MLTRLTRVDTQFSNTQVAAVEAFLQSHVDVNYQESLPDGATVLHYLCLSENQYERKGWRPDRRGHLRLGRRNALPVQKLMKLLLNHGANPELRVNGRTAIECLYHDEDRLYSTSRVYIDSLAMIIRNHLAT